MKEKREMLLKRLNVLVEGREREFLEFMGMGENSFRDWSKLSLEELLNSFIGFEEDNNEEEFTEEVMEEVLNIYTPGFEKGEHVF
jgi:hypothetical protein